MSRVIRQRHITGDLIKAGVLEIGDGYRAKNSELADTGLPFARAGNINNGFLFDDAELLCEESVAKAGSKISRPGDIVFTSKGTVGRFAFVRDNTPRFVYAPQLCYWRVLDTDRIDPVYLYFWMQSKEFLEQVGRVKGLTDMADYVSLTDQRKMSIELPDIAHQRKVSHVLSAYDDLIENNAQRIRNLRDTIELLAPKLFSGQLDVEDLDIEIGEAVTE